MPRAPGQGGVTRNSRPSSVRHSLPQLASSSSCPLTSLLLFYPATGAAKGAAVGSARRRHTARASATASRAQAAPKPPLSSPATTTAAATAAPVVATRCGSRGYHAGSPGGVRCSRRSRSPCRSCCCCCGTRAPALTGERATGHSPRTLTLRARAAGGAVVGVAAAAASACAPKHPLPLANDRFSLARRHARRCCVLLLRVGVGSGRLWRRGKQELAVD